MSRFTRSAAVLAVSLAFIVPMAASAQTTTTITSNGALQSQIVHLLQLISQLQAQIQQQHPSGGPLVVPISSLGTATASTSAQASLTVNAVSGTSVTASYTNMPNAGVKVIRQSDQATVWTQELTTGHNLAAGIFTGSTVINLPASTASGSYILQAISLRGVVYATSTAFTITGSPTVTSTPCPVYNMPACTINQHTVVGNTMANGCVSAPICVANAPTGSPTISANPSSGPAPLTVTFEAAGAPQSSYSLDFGDGTSCSGSSCVLTHVYSQAGIYNAVVSSGDLSASARVIVSAAPSTPSTSPISRSCIVSAAPTCLPGQHLIVGPILSNGCIGAPICSASAAASVGAGARAGIGTTGVTGGAVNVKTLAASVAEAQDAVNAIQAAINRLFGR